ncbi:MAG: hypothetical protein KAI67_05800 [Candidatus Pacebacteria bacterium]|nr:hypothetical protein [Candidatus Paceibacterota bacterium]
MKLINEAIIQDLKQSLGIELLEEENQSEILTKLLELISENAGIKIIENFSDEDYKEFNQIPRDNLEKMENFMISKNPQAEEIFRQEAEAVKRELLGNNT